MFVLAIAVSEIFIFFKNYLENVGQGHGVQISKWHNFVMIKCPLSNGFALFCVVDVVAFYLHTGDEIRGQESTAADAFAASCCSFNGAGRRGFHWSV